MSDKVIVTGISVITDPDPWDVGMVTERLPAQELWEDGIEPDERPSSAATAPPEPAARASRAEPRARPSQTNLI